MSEDTAEVLKGAIRVDGEQLRGHVDEVVRSSVEETLNGLLQAEADQLCGAGRYEHSAKRVDTRAGHYERKLETKAGVVRLKVPKLRTLAFETAIIDRYRRRESSVEEALVEMYLAGVSVRRASDPRDRLRRDPVTWIGRVRHVGNCPRIQHWRGVARPVTSRSHR